MPGSVTAASPPASASPHDLWFDSGNGSRRNECAASVTWGPWGTWAGTSATAVTADGDDLLITSTGGGNWLAASPLQPVAPGDVVSALASVTVPAQLDGQGPLNQARLNLAWYSSSLSLLSVTGGTAVAVAVNATATLAVQGTAPAGAAWFAVQAGDAETSAAGTQLLLSSATASTWVPYAYGTGSVAAGTSIPGAVDNTTITGAVHLNYSTSPGAAGTLISSIAAGPGTDQYGNAYLGGVVNYTPSGPSYLAVRLQLGTAEVLSAAGYGGPYAVIAGFAATPNGSLTVSGANGSLALDMMTSGAGFHFTGGSVTVETGTVRPGQPGNPSSPESWHSPPLPSGASGTLRYQLLAAAQNMQVQAQLTFSPAVSGTVSLFTIPASPAGYIPAGDFRGAASCGSTGTGTLEITTGGAVQVLNVPAGTTEIGFSAIVPLN